MPNTPPENVEYATGEDGYAPGAPFGGMKTANQFIQLAIDPSAGLTRKRYAWFSNGTRFDNTLFSEVEGGIRLETRAAEATDEARISTAYPGQYISQALGQPGIGVIVDDGNTQLDGDNRVSLTHGEVYAGAFYWDDAADTIDTGFAFAWDADGWRFEIRSQGSHIGPSPIDQSDFGADSGDGEGESGYLIDPADGYVYNFPFTWYNEGPIEAAWLNPAAHRLPGLARAWVKGRPSTETANLSPQLVVRNAGTAQSLGVELGGMQYTTYGASEDDLERRITDESRVYTAGEISDTVALTENAVDPVAQPGVPLVSARRESTARDLNLRVTEVRVRPQDDDIYVFAWDEWDPGTALTGATFTDPVSPNNAGEESKILTDTQATDYSPTTAVLRGWEFFEGGNKQESSPQDTEIDLRIPFDATRVFTAVNDGNAADVNPFKARFEEGY